MGFYLVPLKQKGLKRMGQMRQKYRGAAVVIVLISIIATAIIAYAQLPKDESSPDRPFGEKAATATPVPPQPVKVNAPLQGEQAKEAPGSRSNVERKYKGKLIYAFDTARYGAAGFAWPWSSYLVLQHMHGAIQDAGAGKKEWTIASYEVETPIDTFLYEPQFSPDGEYVLFKVGNPFGSSGTYTPYLFNFITQKLQKVPVPHQRVGNRSILWSPDSRYIAYFQGAVAVPLRGGFLPSNLHIYSVETGKDRLIAGEEAVLNSVAWTPQNTLLYSVLPTSNPSSASKPAKGIETGDKDTLSTRPDIYEVPAAGGQPKLVVRDGYRPAVAPDGRWIAFFGSPDSDKSTGEYLLLFNRTKQDRKAIQRRLDNISLLRWTPDSQYLIIITPVHKVNERVETRITEFNVSSGKERLIGVLEYGDKLVNSDEARLAFRPLEVSNDGQFLFFELLGFGNDLENNGLFLKAVDLRNGKIDTVARIGSVRRLDWHDESSPVVKRLP